MDPELFKRMQEAADRFRSGESDYEEIVTPGGLARIVRDDSDPRGFTIDFVGDGARRSVAVQEYPASESRPPGYPAPLPFLAGCAATVDTLDQSVTWSDPPADGFDRVVRECLDDAWTLVDGPPKAPDGASAVCLFEKDDGARALVLSADGGKLVLTEQRPTGAGEA